MAHPLLHGVGPVRRWPSRLAGAVAALFSLSVAAALVAVLWLLYTPAGAEWVAERAMEREPRLELTVVGGSLAHGVEVRNLRWRDDAVRVEIEAAVGVWDAGCLARRLICLHSLWLREVRVVLPEAPPSPDDARGPWDLPPVASPWPVRLGDVAVHGLRITRGDAVWDLNRLEASLSVDGSRWEVYRLHLDHPEGWVEAQGQVRTAGAYPLEATAHGTLTAPGITPRFQFGITAAGTVEELHLEGRVGGPVKAAVEAELAPLDPALPFRLRLEEAEGGWPLESREQVAVSGLRLTAEGDRSGADFMLDGDLDGLHIPRGRWRGSGRVTVAEAVFHVLEGDVLGGRVAGDGRVAWDVGGVQWQTRVEGRDLAPDTKWPGLPTGVEGAVAVTGLAGADGWALGVESERLQGLYRGRPVTAGGRVERALDGAWVLDRVRALSPVGVARVHGRLAEVWDLDVAVEVADLAVLDRRAGGRAELRAHIQGPPSNPGVVASGGGTGLLWEGRRVASLHFDARLPEAGRAPGALAVTARGVDFPEVAFDRVRLRGEGTLALHALEWEMVGPVVEGRLAATGGLDQWTRWRGLITGGSVAVQEQRLDVRAPVHLSWTDGVLALAAHCWAYRDASICMEDVRVGPDRGAIIVDLDGFLFQWLEPWLPPRATWEGGLGGRGVVRWGGAEGLTAELTLEGGEGRMAWVIGEEGDEAEHEIRDLGYERLAAAGRYREGRAEVELDFVSEAAGHARLVVGTDPRPGRRGLDGQVEVEVVRLGFVRTFFPALGPVSGVLSAQGEVGGTWRDPEFRGFIRLTGGRFSAPEWPLRVEGLDLRVDVDGDDAAIAGTFRSGEGRAVIRGAAGWPSGAWWLHMDVTGRDLAVSQPPLLEARVDPDLRLWLAPGEARLEGKVVVASGAVTVHEVPWRAAPFSRDVVVVGREVVEAEPEVPDGWRVAADVEVDLGQALTLAGYGVRGRLTGGLRLRQVADAEPEVIGEIRIEDGVYEAYGQRLAIRRGLLIFFGPPQRPRIEVEAVRRIERDRVTAGVRVEGFADDPTVVLFSEPPMSQEDALSYLVRGRPMGRGGPEGDDVLMHAALALGVYGGGAAAASFAEQLGIREFDIEAVGDDEGAQVVLSGYLSPRLYVAYGVGVFLPGNTVTLRYYLTWQLYLEAVSGMESALDLMYRFEIE